jgi:membrane protein DedA with SNARE-associated domain/membrane-associated phospholipid phosphatase
VVDRGQHEQRRQRRVPCLFDSVQIAGRGPGIVAGVGRCEATATHARRTGGDSLATATPAHRTAQTVLLSAGGPGMCRRTGGLAGAAGFDEDVDSSAVLPSLTVTAGKRGVVEAHLQSLIVYFSAHPQVALSAVFLAATLESLALVGTVIPGSSIVVAGGMLIGLGVLDPWQTAAAAVIGATLGDGISYWLGHHYRQQVPQLWPMRRYPQLLERGQAYFEHHGGKSVFFGRFFGPLRAVVPLAAGMSSMPAVRFYAMNVLSAFAWAAIHLLPGWLFGASLQLAGAVSERLALMLIAAVIVLWALGKLGRFAFTRTWTGIARLRDWLVEGARRRSGPMAQLVLSLLDPARPESRALLAAAVILIGGAWLFLGVLEDVVTNDPLVRFDQSVYESLQGLRTAWADRLMVFVTELGGAPGTSAVIIAMSVWLGLMRRWRTLAYWLAAAGFAEILVWVLKHAIGRARPNPLQASIDPFSFPSGHAALAIVTYGFLAFLLARRKPPGVRALVALPVTFGVLLIAFSRLYLGVHWFSDVIASLSLGIAWVALLGIAYTHHVREAPLRTAPAALIVGSTLALVGLLYVGDRVPGDVLRYAYQPTLTSVSFENWKSGGWRDLPAARSDLRGDVKEPFSLQWVATDAQLASALGAAGWQAPRPWNLRTMLLWLASGTPIEDLPVLPKFDHGDPQTHTWVDVMNARERIVVRLWSMRRVVDAAGAGDRRSVWVGMVTRERLDRPGGLIALVRTDSDFATPLRVLEEDLRKEGVDVERAARRRAPLLLAWQPP